MFNRMALAGFCIITCACSGKQQDMTADRIAGYRRFLCTATAFDYCGASYSTNDVAIASRMFNAKDTLRLLLSEHGHESKSCEFLSLLIKLEKGLAGNGEVVDWDIVNRIKGSLQRQKDSVASSDERFSLFVYGRNLRSLLYSVARIVKLLHCSPDDKSNFMLRIMPEELLEIDLSHCYWIVTKDNWSSQLKIFRNLLMLSCYLDYSCGKEGWQLRGIKDSRLQMLADSCDLCLLGNDREWRMIFADRRSVNLRKLALDDFFCPQIIGHKAVFFSADYSARRAAIFRRGEIFGNKSVRVIRGKIAIETLTKNHQDECGERTWR